MSKKTRSPLDSEALGWKPFTLLEVCESDHSAYQDRCKTGRCAACGKPIKINCIIRSSDNIISAVGSDCVERIDDPALAKTVRREVAKRLAKIRDDAKAERHRKRMAAWQAELDARKPQTHNN